MSGWRPEEGGGKWGEERRKRGRRAGAVFTACTSAVTGAEIAQTSLTSCVYVQNTSIFYGVCVGGCGGLERRHLKFLTIAKLQPNASRPSFASSQTHKAERFIPGVGKKKG